MDAVEHIHYGYQVRRADRIAARNSSGSTALIAAFAVVSEHGLMPLQTLYAST
jgi:hypothetical protein